MDCVVQTSSGGSAKRRQVKWDWIRGLVDESSTEAMALFSDQLGCSIQAFVLKCVKKPDIRCGPLGKSLSVWIVGDRLEPFGQSVQRAVKGPKSAPVKISHDHPGAEDAIETEPCQIPNILDSWRGWGNP
jgi:hypothetical protein